MKKLIVVLTLLCSTVSYAEHNNDNSKYGLYWNSIPAACGTPEEVQRYIEDKGLEPVHLSLGRTGSQPDGDPVYMVTYYENENNETLVTVDIPNATETCILYHTFDKSFAKQKKKGI